MSKFERRFQLIQHTPMIHFQGDQMGATLRASELKPKLDEFLKKKIQNRKAYEKWLIPEQEEALNYKVRVVLKQSCENNVTSRTNAPMYFGDTGNKKEGKSGEPEIKKTPKYLNLTKSRLEVVIFSFYAGLLEEIETYFAEFLFLTNFGTRQSKGYGSFFLTDCGEFKFPSLPYIKFPKSDLPNEKPEIIFQIIQYYYQLLKSGINYPKIITRNIGGKKIRLNGESMYYRKGYLLQFSEKYGYTWEKKWMKDKFIKKLDSKPNNQKFVRALLGLGPSFMFIPESKIINPRDGKVYPKGSYPLNITVTHKEEKITRYKSPITFKPILIGGIWKIYILIDTEKISEKMRNKTFIFRDTHSKKTEELMTPDKSFDINKLISSYHKDFKGKMTIKVVNNNQIVELVDISLSL